MDLSLSAAAGGRVEAEVMHSEFGVTEKWRRRDGPMQWMRQTDVFFVCNDERELGIWNLNLKIENDLS